MDRTREPRHHRGSRGPTSRFSSPACSGTGITVSGAIEARSSICTRRFVGSVEGGWAPWAPGWKMRICPVQNTSNRRASASPHGVSVSALKQTQSLLAAARQAFSNEPRNQWILGSRVRCPLRTRCRPRGWIRSSVPRATLVTLRWPGSEAGLAVPGGSVHDGW